jgi:hypothetical protein
MTDKPTYMSPADEMLFASIGRLTISWAIIEGSLDVIVSIIHHRIGGKAIEPEMPWALKRKLKYIRRCFSKIEALKSFADPVPNLMTDILSASEMRQNIIHGVATHHPQGASTIKMTRLIRGGEFYFRKNFQVTTIEILQAAVAANKLSARILAVYNVLLAKFPPEKRD